METYSKPVFLILNNLSKFPISKNNPNLLFHIETPVKKVFFFKKIGLRFRKAILLILRLEISPKTHFFVNINTSYKI